MSTMPSFKNMEIKHGVYRGKDCMENFCKSLRELTMKIINLKKNELTKEQQDSYKNAKICYIRKEKIENKYLKDKKYRKVKGPCHYTQVLRIACVT